MEFVTIYENEEQKVVIPKRIADELQFIGTHQRQLSKIEQEQFLYDTLDYVKNFFELKGKRIVTDSKAIILSKGSFVNITEVYDSLTDAMLMISESYDIVEKEPTLQWKIDLELMIKLYYKLINNQNCIVHFYNIKANGVSGFAALEEDDKVLILPIVFNEDGNQLRLY